MRKTIERGYGLLVRAAGALESPFLLAVRLYWGWQFALTGLGKLENMDRTIGFFRNLGIPAPGINAPFVATLEFVGGILLALGLGSRLVALLLTCNLLVAFLAADREALLGVFSDPNKFASATPFPFLLAMVVVLIFGPGEWSLDAVIGRKRASQ